MNNEKVTKCDVCGFAMHVQEKSCLQCQWLADWQEEQLKSLIAARYRAKHPHLRRQA